MSLEEELFFYDEYFSQDLFQIFDMKQKVM